MTTEIDAEGLAKAEAAFFDIHGPMSGFDKDALGSAITAYLASTSASEAEPVVLTEQNSTVFGYVNWRGEFGVRTVVPLRVWFGATDWHPEPCWLLTAFDIDKQAERDFAINCIRATHPTPASDDQVEAVARAIAGADEEDYMEDHARYDRRARAALAAMGSTKP